MNDCSICKNYEPVTAKMAGQKTAKGNPDVVEVVRCKDCKWFVDEGMLCGNNIFIHFDHFYCYYGERKENK